MEIKKKHNYLFSFCEFYLSNIRFNMPRVTLSSKMAVINLLINRGGIGGILTAYVIMVMRRTNINLPLFRSVAILDIKAGLIYNKPTIRDEYKNIILKRFHFPSIQIMKEIIQAYKEYKEKINKKIVNIPLISEENKKYHNSRKEKIEEKALLNGAYLLWMFHYYLYRSICYSNLIFIKENIKGVVTIEEYTPQIAGYISVFLDLKIPLFLYLHGKIFIPELTVHSLEIYDRIIYAPGVDVEILKKINTRICKEKIYVKEMRMKINGSPHVGLFLSSFYELNDDQIYNYVLKKIIPFIEKIKKKWNAKEISIYCHPNDTRPHKILVSQNLIVDEVKIKDIATINQLDLVVVSNSSVAEEALKMGVPVVYTNELDTYSYDIYGYVQHKVIIDGTINLPTLENICEFFQSIETKQNLNTFFYKNNSQKNVDFIEAIKI